MSVATETPTQCPPAEELYRMTAAAFLRAVEADVFPEKDKVFLLNGRIYRKMAKKLPHAAGTASLLDALIPVVPEGWGFWVENPILTDTFSAPLPDLCIIRGNARDYYQRRSFPNAEDIALVVEVARSSLGLERTDAMVNYVGAGLPVYWIVNLVDWQVEVYTGPERVGDVARYRSREDYPADRDVPLTIDGVEVSRVPARLILPGDRPRVG